MIAIIGADRMEFDGLPKGEVGDLPVHHSRVVDLGGRAAVLVANGAGWRRAEMAVEAVLLAHPVATLVSTGFCGALDPRLQPGDLFIPTLVRCQGADYRTRNTGGDGILLSVDHVVQTVSEKRFLHAKGAAAVEMEAGAVAAIAQARGIPFFCVRAVSDDAHHELQNDFNAALRPDGRFDTMKLFTSAICRPASRLPELIRLRNRCRRAASRLGDFLVRHPF